VSGRPPRALAATVVAVVADGAHEEAVQALVGLCRDSAVQPIVVSLGTKPDAMREDHDGVVVFRGLLPRYLNNAVASLRLSSLPALGWWRTNEAGQLRDLAVLVDRLVLDAPDPLPHWRQLPQFAELTAVSDIRWARLTRWRDLLAQYFDLPEVRRLAAPFTRAVLVGTDAPTVALFAGWLRSRLPGGAGLELLREAGDAAPLERVELLGEAGCISLSLLPHSSCVQTSIEGGSQPSSTRIVPAGESRLDVLLRGELRIRSRDLAFEDAAREALTS
jgi:glucose-6-phosphate dehydrogenase assembly protein OpcA